MIIESKITIIIVYLYFCVVGAAIVVTYDDMLFFSFCFCLLLLLLLLFVYFFFVCIFLFFLLLSLSFFRFLSWFSISLTCSIYIHRHVTFFCTLVLGSTNIFYYIPVKLSVISLFTLK